MASDQQNINSPNEQEHQHDPGVRKLCAIMFTDIKDFSGKMQRDEVGTMRMLGIHNRMMNDDVNKFGGTVIKTVGDAYLVTFDSVVSATQCAIDVQQAFIQYNTQIKNEDEKITVRIGVHLGDVFVKDKDVFGDGVNIASRIQSMAEVGGVNISESVYQQVQSKLNIKVINLGVPQLKNISTPVKIYQIIVIPTDKARGKLATNLFVFKTILKRKKTKRLIGISFGSLLLIAAVVWYFFFKAAPPPNSLAVLPFDYNGDPGYEYIADGFTDDILSSLSRMTHIKVLSSGSTFRYKNTKISEDSIAKALNVRYLLRGTLILNGDRLKIRFRLVEPREQKDNKNIDYDKSKSGLSQIRSEILREVVGFFETNSSGEYAPKPEAYEHFMSGLEYDRKERKEDNQLAIAELTQAIEKDSTFIPAYLKLASMQLLNHEWAYDLSEKWLIEADNNIRKVLSIDTGNAEAYWLMGRFFNARGDRKKGVEFLEKSIQMDPNFMRAYVTLATEYMFNLGEPAKAVTLLTKAYDIEPTNYNISLNLGICYAMLKKYDEAIEAFRKASERNPEHELPWIDLAHLFELLGKQDSALLSYETALRLNPKNATTAEYLSVLFLNKGEYVRADSTLVASLNYDPSNPRLLYTLGLTKSLRSQKEAAKKTWNEGLRFAEDRAKENPNLSEHYMNMALFNARLGDAGNAITNAQHAYSIDSTDEEMVIGLSRVYAILGKKKEMISWFSRARTMNSEYDATFIAQDLDFQSFKTDEDLIMAAKK